MERTINDLLKMQKKVDDVMAMLDENSELIQRLSRDVYKQHSGQIDEIVSKIQNLLQQIREKKKTNYSDEYLELQCLAIPAALYDVVDALEDLGCKQDLSKINYDEVYAEVYSGITQGTIPDKEAEAKSKSIAEKVTAEIYKRAYNKLKKKFDTAMELHSSIKKVLDKRIKSLEVFRRDNTPGDMRGAVDEHEGRV